MFHRNHAAEPSTSVDQGKFTNALFLVNPRNEAFAHGQADKPAPEPAVGCMLLFLVPFVLAGVLITGWTVVQWRDWVVLTNSGANTTGYFTDFSSSEGDDSTTYHASYRYVVDDYEYIHKEQISYDVYRRGEVGGSTQVLYFTGDPNIATLDLSGGNRLRVFLSIFMLCWDGFIGLLFLGNIHSIMTNNQLAKTGRVTFGQIVALRSHYDSDNDLQIEVDYTFNSPTSGKLIQAKHKFQDNSRKNQPLPKSGAAVAVLYAEDKIYRLL